MDANIVGLIIGLILAAITLFLIFWGNKKSNASIEARTQSEYQTTPPMQADVTEPMKMETAVPAALKADDLTIIEGIGPKINTILQLNGIQTFAQLAATDTDMLMKLLKDNELSFAKPGSWPEQARLAAEGRMAELKELQDRLIAGR
jgi:predicted flap endonuclease-1-like 5' DNA nuclease